MSQSANIETDKTEMPEASVDRFNPSESTGQDDVIDIYPSENDLNMDFHSSPPKSKSQILQGRNLAPPKR